jgi:integrase
MSSLSPSLLDVGPAWPTPSPIAWDDFSREILSLYQPPLRARGTRVRLASILRQVAALGVARTDELTPSLVARFIAAQPAMAPRTLHGYVGVLRSACNYAAATGRCAISPFSIRKSWVRKGAPTRVQHHHSAAEIARVLELARRTIDRKQRPWSRWRAHRTYALVSVFAYSGLRRNEGLYLRTEDLDFAGRMILVHPGRHRLKTEGSAAPVPMAEELAAILLGWLPQLSVAGLPPGPERDPGWIFPNFERTGPWRGGSKGYRPIDRLKRLGVRAGVENLTFLSLRHSWATHAESLWGLSDLQIARVLRHTNTRTQTGYRHPDLPNLRDKVRGISFGPAPEGPSRVDP